MKTKKFCIKAIIFFVLIVSLSSFSFAQSAAFFTTVLEAESVSWEQAVYLVMAGSERLPEDADPNQAWQLFTETQWIKKVPEPQSPIKTSQYSRLIARAFKVKGGLFYTIFKNDRYSYRELVHKNVIPGSMDPGSAVKGTDALKILDKAISLFPVDANAEDK
ncbi:MAG: hypothetical protein GX660_26970 [Clostridiaceae bacterium]|nr:hypothetical protein [Clostridiaceae bacterium]